MNSFSMSVSSLYIALCGLLLLRLAYGVVKQRLKHKVGVGTGDQPELERMIRVHGNAVEYVPIALLLLIALENVVGITWLVHGMGCTLLIGRLLHAWGLSASAGESKPRFIGTLLTWTMILSSSLLVIWFNLMG